MKKHPPLFVGDVSQNTFNLLKEKKSSFMLDTLPSELVVFIAGKIESSQNLKSFAKINRYIYLCVKSSLDPKVQKIFPDSLLNFVNLKFQDKMSVKDYKTFQKITPEPEIAKEAVARAFSWALLQKKDRLIKAFIKNKYFDPIYVNNFLSTQNLGERKEEILAAKWLYENRPVIIPSVQDFGVSSFQL